MANGSYQIQDVLEVCDSEEVTFVFDHLLSTLPAHRVGLWLKLLDADTLQLVLNRRLQAWASYDPPLQIATSEGIVGAVFREQKSKVDDGLYRSRDASSQIDEKIKQRTGYQVTVPFYLNGGCVGVLSAVQLLNEPVASYRSWGFTPECVVLMEGFSKILSVLCERHLQR